jgi:hypothetical protein
MMRIELNPQFCSVPRRVCGQALTEFLVLAVALIPLFLLMPMIGKYQDIVHATQMASRYVAFEATTREEDASKWKTPAMLAQDVRRRFYSNLNAPIKNDDAAGDFDANRNLFWRDPYGHPLIKDFNNVSVAFGNGTANQTGGYEGASDGVPFNMIPILANAATLGLPAKGIYTGNVTAKLENLPPLIQSIAPFDAINLSVTRHTSLVSDGWSAESPQMTEDRFGRMAPINAALDTIQPLLAIAIGYVDLAEVRAPEFGKLQKWRDVVPADRLGSPQQPQVQAAP